MPYSAAISRANPTCLVFVIDQSESMSQPFAGQADRSKAQGVADAINRLIQNLALKCAKSDGIRDYFHVAVIGYGGKVSQQIRGAIVGQRLVPVSVLANNPMRVEQRDRVVEDAAGNTITKTFKFPIWFDPIADGKTPMCEALGLARDTVAEFLSTHRDCYPPAIIHLTDGRPTDGIPTAVAQEIRQLKSSDGNVLLYNVHVSAKSAPLVAYPADESACPDEFARMLFQISSPLPPRTRDLIAGQGLPVSAGSRGFVFNADLTNVIRFFDVGTRMADPLR